MANTKTDTRANYPNPLSLTPVTVATTKDDKGNSHTATNADREKAIKESQDGLANQTKAKK